VVEARGGARERQVGATRHALMALLDRVSSLDEDRILRSYIDVIDATLRTSYYQPDADGDLRAYIAFKFDSAQVPELPRPRPYREIFVYGPRVEGVHLRFGPVARGGLRWSDRREDFRTEVLGLVKAQMVKNTVIVPVGAKGGFFVKRLPAGGDRDAIMAEGIACYRTFINGLLEITDNLVDGEVVPPPDVVRHDGDDPYLVVAADKGTATFSDIANGIAAEHGFWLGDAFASGGSVGYDHKGMGITAKGAGNRSSATSARWGATARSRTSPWSASATCPATCSATACCCPGTSGWWPPSTTATSSSTRTRTPRARSRSASACSSCRARAGRTTTSH
jgi:glutamate dehydrogenase